MAPATGTVPKEESDTPPTREEYGTRAMQSGVHTQSTFSVNIDISPREFINSFVADPVPREGAMRDDGVTQSLEEQVHHAYAVLRDAGLGPSHIADVAPYLEEAASREQFSLEAYDALLAPPYDRNTDTGSADEAAHRNQRAAGARDRLYARILQLPEDEQEQLSNQLLSHLGKKRTARFGFYGKMGGGPTDPKVTERRQHLLYDIVLPLNNIRSSEGLDVDDIRNILDNTPPPQVLAKVQENSSLRKYYTASDTRRLQISIHNDLRYLDKDPKRYVTQADD